MMMKIALLGAPGSGKTDIANRLVRNLNRDKSDHKWKVIDGYVEDLALRTGRDYGDQAGFPHNIQVMTERWGLEAEAQNKGFSTITCGTIYETIIYSARVLQGWQPSNEDQILIQGNYADLCMRFLMAMADSTYNYDQMFFLPWDESHPGDRTWDSVVNAKLTQVLDGAFKVVDPLTGTTRQKVTNALAKIRFIRTFDHPSDAPEPDG